MALLDLASRTSELDERAQLLVPGAPGGADRGRILKEAVVVVIQSLIIYQRSV